MASSCWESKFLHLLLKTVRSVVIDQERRSVSLGGHRKRAADNRGQFSVAMTPTATSCWIQRPGLDLDSFWSKRPVEFSPVDAVLEAKLR